MRVTIYDGTVDELIAAGIIKPPAMPPVQKRKRRDKSEMSGKMLLDWNPTTLEEIPEFLQHGIPEFSESSVVPKDQRFKAMSPILGKYKGKVQEYTVLVYRVTKTDHSDYYVVVGGMETVGVEPEVLGPFVSRQAAMLDADDLIDEVDITDDEIEKEAGR